VRAFQLKRPRFALIPSIQISFLFPRYEYISAIDLAIAASGADMIDPFPPGEEQEHPNICAAKVLVYS
jgi:hypothetical protein